MADRRAGPLDPVCAAPADGQPLARCVLNEFAVISRIIYSLSFEFTTGIRFLASLHTPA